MCCQIRQEVLIVTLQVTAQLLLDTSESVVRAFDSDGFTVGNNSVVNTSASTTFAHIRKQESCFDIVTYREMGHQVGQ